MKSFGRFPCRLVVVFAFFGTLILTGCNRDSTSSKARVEFSRDNSATRLGHAVDNFRLEPSHASRCTVERELTGLEVRIQSIEDRAIVADGTAKAQLLLDAEALRNMRAAHVARFNAPLENRKSAVVSQAAKAEPVAAEAVQVAEALPATAEETVPVRKAIPVASATPAVAVMVAAVSSEGTVPVRRAEAVHSPEDSQGMLVIQSDSGRRLTIWQPDRSALARR